MISFLIVEDDENLRDIYESLIRKNYKNVHIDHAANGKCALEKAKEINYTAIIIDIDIPLLSGAELYKELKKESPLLAGRTVFVSGKIYDSENAFILEESRPHLAKPFAKEAFDRLISYVVSKEKTNFQNTHEAPCKRQSIRTKAREESLLVFTNQDSGIIEQASCKTINYSIYGLAVIHEKGKLSLPSHIDVSVNKLNIRTKKARVAWMKYVDGVTLSGLAWV